MSVAAESNLSRPLSSAPPPVSQIPRSIISDDGSGARRADADVPVSGGVRNGESRADCGRHGLFDGVGFAGAGLFRGLKHGAPFDTRDAAGHADQNARLEESFAADDLADEMLQHP